MPKYATLEANAAFSLGVLTAVRDGLAATQFENVRTIAIAGSFGRLEASRASDADFIVVLDETMTSEEQSADLQERVVEATALEFEKFGILRPNPEGVFARPRSMAELLPPVKGGGFGTPNESNELMGKRLLLLLESRPLWSDTGYDAVITDIFDRYASYVADDMAKEYVYLLNDLIRYFRYICVNYQSTFGNQNEKWAIRNLKLRHSRLVMYAGLLFLVGHASQFQDDRKLNVVRDGLSMTPLERIQLAYEDSRDFGFFRLAGLYNTFLERISDPTLRVDLNAIAYAERYENPYFSALKANSDAFQAELARFLFGRRGQWSDRFFEYLVL